MDCGKPTQHSQKSYTVACIRFRHETSNQITGQLPRFRETECDTFTNVDTNFAGVLSVASVSVSRSINFTKFTLCFYMLVNMSSAYWNPIKANHSCIYWCTEAILLASRSTREHFVRQWLHFHWSKKLLTPDKHWDAWVLWERRYLLNLHPTTPS